MKKLLSLILSLTMLVSVCQCFVLTASAQSYEEQLIEAGFPLTYIDDLVALKTKYPNWEFRMLDTGLNFDTAVKGEMKNTPTTEANIRKYLDPRNWLDEKHIFQFESIKKEDSTQTQAGVEGILSGTWMANSLISFKDGNGDTKKYDSTTKYSNAMLTASKNSGLSAYYIASKIRQENGGTTNKANAVSGIKAPFNGIYNYYNIGAYSGASDGLHWAAGCMWAVRDTFIYSDYDAIKKTVSGTKTPVAKNLGAGKNKEYFSYISTHGNYIKVKQYIKNGSNSYSTNGVVGYILKADTDFSSLGNGRPWTNPYLSITNGATYIANGYLKNQYTMYLQKWNVNPASNSLYSHEYMSNYSGAVSEAEHLYNGYKKANIMASKHVFYIPVFEGMGVTISKPTGLKVSSYNATSVTLAWNKQTVASGYNVYRYDATKKEYTLVKTVEGNTTTTCKVTGLKSGNIYYYAISAYYDEDEKHYVGGKCGYIKCWTKPATVTLSKLTALSGHKIKVDWKKASYSASGYQIYWAKDKAFKNVIARTTVAGQSKITYTGKNFTKGRTYYIKVRSYKTIDGTKYYGAWSAIKSVKAK